MFVGLVIICKDALFIFLVDLLYVCDESLLGKKILILSYLAFIMHGYLKI